MESVIEGDFVDIKNIKTRSVVQMVIELPIERAEELVNKFGYPNNHTQCPVAVARLKPKSVEEKVKSKAGEGKLLAQDERFDVYLRAEHSDVYKDITSMSTEDISLASEMAMKEIIKIDSCSELKEGSPAYFRFKELRRDFNNWKIVKSQAESYGR